MALTITEMAKELGVRPDTLRYYERTGLISSAGRTPGGYRVFDDNVADRVRLIKAAQRSGLRLRSIAELLSIADGGNCPCGHTADLVKQRIAEVDAEIEHLQALRNNLVRLEHTTRPAAARPSESGPAASPRLQKEVTRHDLPELRLRLPVFAVLLLRPLK